MQLEWHRHVAVSIYTYDKEACLQHSSCALWSICQWPHKSNLKILCDSFLAGFRSAQRGVCSALHGRLVRNLLACCLAGTVSCHDKALHESRHFLPCSSCNLFCSCVGTTHTSPCPPIYTSRTLDSTSPTVFSRKRCAKATSAPDCAPSVT